MNIRYPIYEGVYRILTLKSYGFKWSPRYQAWQRQLTQNAVYAVKRVLNLQNL